MKVAYLPALLAFLFWVSSGHGVELSCETSEGNPACEQGQSQPFWSDVAPYNDNRTNLAVNFISMDAAISHYRTLAQLKRWKPLKGRFLLREGRQHPQVAAIRERLRILGDYIYDHPLANQGYFDSRLTAAVMAFQRRHGLKIDGIVGPNTRKAMNITPRERWQQLPLPDEALLKTDYQALFDSYRPQLQGLPIESLLVQLIDLLQLLIKRLPKVKSCLTHHDLHPGNLCIDQQSLIVIDWEYSGVGNPWFDAAALVEKFAVNEMQIGRLTAFSHLSQQELSKGLKQARWMMAALECLWYWARGLEGSKLTTAELMRNSLQLLKTRPMDPSRP